MKKIILPLSLRFEKIAKLIRRNAELNVFQRIYRRFFANTWYGPYLKKIVLPFYLRFEKIITLRRSTRFIDFKLLWQTNTEMLSSGIVTGGSRFIIKNGKCYLNVRYNTKNLKDIYKEYFFQEELLGILKYSPKSGKIATSKPKPDLKLSGVWLSLLSQSSCNWMHFLSEYAAILESIINKHPDLKFGILYEADIPAQALECLRILSKGRDTYQVAIHQNIMIEKLIIPECNPSTCISVWPRKGFKGTGYFEYDSKSLLAVRKTLLANYNINPCKQNKYFINRESSFRFITNNDAIQKALDFRGFVPILPGTMTLQEQMQVFSQAAIVVAQAGSALANIMFMPEGSQVICMCAKSEWVNFEYFKDYANIFNVKLQYIVGNIDNPCMYDENIVCSVVHPMNANFYIALQELENALS